MRLSVHVLRCVKIKNEVFGRLCIRYLKRLNSNSTIFISFVCFMCFVGGKDTIFATHIADDIK